MTRTLNLGILAHVDAGKTSLTERLLFDTGAIDRLGSVDGGDTRTDRGAVERRRGITVRAAVAAFTIGDLQVNLVDTPGHPDFVAEVERALPVLDGAILVISAVEGVQAQTRVLMRSLRALGLPTLLFVNKIDRAGARDAALIAEIGRRLGVPAVPMQTVTGLGTRRAAVTLRGLDDADFRTELATALAERDDRMLAALVDDVVPSAGAVRRALHRQTTTGRFHPVWFGSALDGTGIPALLAAIRDHPRPARPPVDTVRGTVFAVERDGGERTAYLRLWSGSLQARQRVTFRRPGPGGRVAEHTARIGNLSTVGGGDLVAGGIGVVRGMALRIGDEIGDTATRGPQFSPPVLEAVVRPVQPGEEARLHAALQQLADEDPLIRTRTVPGGATSVLLYGAVQQEVFTERLAAEFGIGAAFEPVRPVCFTRPAGAGHGLYAFDRHGPNEFWQTVGLRVEPLPPGTGNRFLREAERGLLPRGYHQAIEDAVFATLHEGIHGQETTDCAVTVTRLDYVAPLSSAADFRALTPRVLRAALADAGLRVHEPAYRLELEIPDDTLSAVIGMLAGLAAEVGQITTAADGWRVAAVLPARLLSTVARRLPGLTRGEGALWHSPGGDLPVSDRSGSPTGSPPPPAARTSPSNRPSH
ncbi:elongation factor G [Actinoplanes rectilineatus]|uniref:elongation factor G n=1 Tax=Actinoplanes rectilineatus TaxID=113571 RepID=UPI001FDF99BD|nr:TetM/TetW/TetO/TetS family tetracycline resistance ribosomal protection protein [Actinoplanes rectilineatus]